MWPKIIERILNPLLLFFFSNTFVLLTVFWLAPASVFVGASLWAVLALAALWALMDQRLMSAFLKLQKVNWFIFPFLLFAGLSIFWSVYWEVSLFRWLTFLFVLIVGGYIGMRYEVKKILEFLSVFGLFILFLSTIFVFFFPQVGVMNYHNIQGAWMGIFWHKNHMGLIAAFVTILVLVNLVDSLQARGKRALVWGALYLFSLFFTYQTDSVAAYLTVIGLHGLVLLVVFLQKFGRKIHTYHYVIFGILVVASAVALFANLDHLFGLFNRNTSMTGRIPMWGYLFSTYLSHQPLGGYGFNAFWYLESHRVGMQVLAGYPDPILISDNGFIDILMNTGFIGLGLFLVFYFGAWWRCLKGSLKATDIIGAFPVIFMAYTLLANISWSLVFENESFFLLVMVALLFSTFGKVHPVKST